MPKLIIDGQEIEIEEGLTVMQACKAAGKEIPHFCFHERLNIAGNCRMCLVELEKAPKLIASCAMPVSEGMVIHTNNPKVQKAREGVMEFLLINHPLDCPICDQGGECDLQDQAFKYGRGGSRFQENKRAVHDKNMGPLIKTHMTRCIHCTRCVRFATEIAGVEELGTLHRGEHMEIATYLERSLSSELSGNMIDLCPVGALTSKPYAFKARSWELTKTESIDVLDALGSNIRIDSRGMEVMRILPKLNEEINEEWLSDKARFSYDGLKYQRLDRPYIRSNGKLVECSWQQALDFVAEKLSALKGDEVGAIAGFLACCESMFILKKLLNSIGCEQLSANQYDYKIDASSRGNYLFNASIEGVEKADFALLIGANVRQAAPVLNARIGRLQRQGKLKVARIGQADDQTYKIEELGASPSIIKDILAGKHEFAKVLGAASNPMIIIGDGVYSRQDGYALLALIHELAEKFNLIREDWNGFNILHNHASMVGALDIGFMPSSTGGSAAGILEKARAGEIRLLYLLGADEIDLSGLNDTFVVYQGHHGDKGANKADVILPGAAYTEKNATYVNLEGRSQRAMAAVAPPGKAQADWLIIRDLARKMNVELNMPDLPSLREQMASWAQAFADIDCIAGGKFVKFASSAQIINSDIMKVPINYYMTDAISRASVTMARCAQSLLGKEQAA